MTTSWPTFLVLASAVGGVDVIYFHVYRFRLAARAESRAETLAHLVQALSFAAIAAGALASWGRGALLAAFAVHFVSIGADVLVERRSRAALGGLPPAEILLHVAGATLTGAAFGGCLAAAPGPVELWQRLALGLGVVGSGTIVVVECIMVGRAARIGQRGGSTALNGATPRSVAAEGARA